MALRCTRVNCILLETMYSVTRLLEHFSRTLQSASELYEAVKSMLKCKRVFVTINIFGGNLLVATAEIHCRKNRSFCRGVSTLVPARYGVWIPFDYRIKDLVVDAEVYRYDFIAVNTTAAANSLWACLTTLSGTILLISAFSSPLACDLS